MPLTATGLVKYGDYTFDSSVRTSVTAIPQLDDAGRTFKWIGYTVAVRALVHADGGLDTLMGGLRKQLLTPAQAFHYDAGKGFGSFTIDGSPIDDVAWGPFPRRLHFDPIGDNKSAWVDWEVEVRIPECLGSTSYKHKIMSAGYTVTYDIDTDGLTTVTYAGFLEIPMTRETPTSGTLDDNADKYREQIASQTILGFQRESQSYKVSLDKRRLDFSIVDKEIPIALPAGVTQCNVTHTVDSALGKKRGAFRLWGNTIAGTVTTSPSKNAKADGFSKFMIIVNKRQEGIRGRGGLLIAQEFSISEELTAFTSRFSLRYLSSAGEKATAQQFLTASGMWNGIGTDFASWKASLDDQAWKPRGIAGLTSKPSDDTIIDLCLQSTVANPTQNPTNNQPKNQPGQLPPPTKKPPAPASWLWYECFLSVDEDDRIAVHKPLKSPGAPVPPKLPYDKLQPENTDKLQVGEGGTDDVPDIEQKVSGPTFTITLWGSAIRCGYPITTPSLVTVGGKKVTQLRCRVTHGVATQVDDTPINTCSWIKTYHCTEQPTDLKIPANPMLAIPAQ